MPKFKKKPKFIEAIRLQHEVVTYKSNGEMYTVGSIGDWLLTGEDGTQFCLKNSKFMEHFEPADEGAEDYLEKYGTVVIEPKDFEDIVVDSKPIKNKISFTEHPVYTKTAVPPRLIYPETTVGNAAIDNVLTRMNKDKTLKEYRETLYQERIKELQREIFGEEETSKEK